MGSGTYTFIQNMNIEFPYKGKSCYVITRNESLIDNDDVKFIFGDTIIDNIHNLIKSGKENIWLVGGGEVNTLLANADLIDEVIVFVMPIMIGEGKS